MIAPLRHAGLAALLSLAALPAALAQATPSAQDLIEQLKPRPATLGQRRSFKAQRLEEPASGAASTAAPPSVSLSIEFDFNSARVRDESLTVLSNLAQALQSEALKETRFLIEGHTDGAGRADYNQRLSTQRAHAVSRWLVKQGVPPARLTALGKGSSELADPAHPTAAANRRVKIVNLDQP